MRQENTTVTTPVHCAKTLKDHLGAFAGKGIPKVYLNIIVQVNILPSTSRYVNWNGYLNISSFFQFSFSRAKFPQRKLSKCATCKLVYHLYFFSYLAFNLTSFFVLSTTKIYHSFDHKNMIYIYPHWIESTQKSNKARW